MLPRAVIGTCAVCGNPATDRDHNHRTGKIRGVLCAHCNRAAGQLRDNPETAEKLAAYLRQPDTDKAYVRDAVYRRTDRGKATQARASARYRASHLAKVRERQRLRVARLRARIKV